MSNNQQQSNNSAGQTPQYTQAQRTQRTFNSQPNYSYQPGSGQLIQDQPQQQVNPQNAQLLRQLGYRQQSGPTPEMVQLASYQLTPLLTDTQIAILFVQSGNQVFCGQCYALAEGVTQGLTDYRNKTQQQMRDHQRNYHSTSGA